MIDPSFSSFCAELALIKSAQDDGEKSYWGEVAKTVAQNIGAGALGYGLGTGAGYGLGYGAQKLLGKLTPTKLKVIRGVGGALGGVGGLFGLAAYNEAQRRVENARKQVTDGQP